ncbi:uncharacterized protein ARMOST_07611 [Armillaria ostoyae]|uniref:RING-type domain-containing protein n=1 Tax=Armillaria ostoyae TaxID=47428 RepID=A0A284R6C3_ARMOS|nr:uncharacterized protein ARMOST_07611 [Armillaria ostoyae]
MTPSRTPNLKSFTKSSLSVKSPEMPYEKKFIVVQHLLGKTTARNIAKRLKRDDSESISASWRHDTCKICWDKDTRAEYLLPCDCRQNCYHKACLEVAWNTAGQNKCPFCRGDGMFAVHMSWVAVDLVDRAVRKEVSHRKKRKMAKKLARDAEKQLEKLNSIKSRYSGANDGRPSEAPEVIEID